MARRIVNMSVLPGEPVDGTGRVIIHYLVRDARGPSVEPHVLHPGPNKGELVARPTRVRLACDSRRRVGPSTVRGVTTVVHRTEEPGAVTCPKCKATAEYAAAVGNGAAANAAEV